MRTKRPLALLTPAIVLEVASHMAMGVALGLGFAFILMHIAAFGIGALLDLSADPENAMQVFVMTCVTTFGIGATFTGIVLMTIKDGE